MSKQVGEFESKFVSELDSGLLVTEDTYGGLEGWYYCVSKFPLSGFHFRKVNDWNFFLNF